MAERALADADQADARGRGGDERPLLGVPIAVKDTEDVAGEVTRWGTAAFSEPAARDGEMVSRLRAAGAVIIGKTNLPELAIIGDTEGPTFGVTRNPWNAGRLRGRLERRQRRCCRGRARGGRHRLGRGGIDPHPRRQLRARRASSRSATGSRCSPMSEHWYGLSVVGFEARSVADTALLLDVGSGHGRPAALRRSARTRLPGGCAWPCPPSRRSVATGRRRSCGGPSRRRPSCCARSATR